MSNRCATSPETGPIPPEKAFPPFRAADPYNRATAMVDDRTLMTRIARGDEQSFNDLVGRHSGRLLGVARRLLGSPADAEDAVQRAFMRCYTGARTYRPEWEVATWLYRILANTCVDEMRRRAAAGRRDLAHAARPGAAGAGSPPEQRIDLQRALARVPREARLLLALRYVDGLSYSEMARIRGITVNTVKSQLARGKSIMKTALQRGGRKRW
jgi:RNA polymerase sigma-70 factor (ECF subfamily)